MYLRLHRKNTDVFGKGNVSVEAELAAFFTIPSEEQEHREETDWKYSAFIFQWSHSETDEEG